MSNERDLQGIEPQYVKRAEEIIETLQTYFVDMPKGANFPERDRFERGYEAFLKATDGGTDLSAQALLDAIRQEPIALVILRAILKCTPPEAASLAIEEAAKHGEVLLIRQSHVREIDALARQGNAVLVDDLDAAGPSTKRNHLLVVDLVTRLVPLLERGPDSVPDDRVHRFDSIDTRRGAESLRKVLAAGEVPYADLLYERVLGRPFASHRDSVSSIVGDIIDDAVEQLLRDNRIAFYRSRQRESIPGMSQAPDFLIPSRENPEILIEDKLTEDDGTARDKVARVQNLRRLEDIRKQEGQQPRAVVSIIDGRGFGVRIPDLQNLFAACDGHVYTTRMINQLVESGGLLEPYIDTATKPEPA